MFRFALTAYFVVFTVGQPAVCGCVSETPHKHETHTAAANVGQGRSADNRDGHTHNGHERTNHRHGGRGHAHHEHDHPGAAAKHDQSDGLAATDCQEAAQPPHEGCPGHDDEPTCPCNPDRKSSLAIDLKDVKLGGAHKRFLADASMEFATVCLVACDLSPTLNTVRDARSFDGRSPYHTSIEMLRAFQTFRC